MPYLLDTVGTGSNKYVSSKRRLQLSLFQGVEGFDLHDSLEAAWNYEGKYAINLFTNKALQIIENHAQEKPLFLYLAHLGAHAAGKDILGVPNINRTNTKYSHITNPLRRRYAEIVERIDKSTGEIVQKLSEKNMLKNCIILLISDNGAPSDGESYNSGSNYPLRGVSFAKILKYNQLMQF